jgi:hypothetical protein
MIREQEIDAEESNIGHLQGEDGDGEEYDEY